MERFFDVMKFRVHVFDIFAQTKQIECFTASLQIHDGGFLAHMFVLAPDRLRGVVSL